MTTPTPSAADNCKVAFERMRLAARTWIDRTKGYLTSRDEQLVDGILAAVAAELHISHARAEKHHEEER